MADPVSLAAFGAVAGAATNKKDPLKGALMGATLGFGGGQLAPTLLGSSAAAGAAGGSFMPAAALETQMAAAPASALSGLVSKAATPQALMAGSRLASSMQPQMPPAQALPLRQGKDVPLSLEQIQAVNSGLFDTPSMMREYTMMRDPLGRQLINPIGYIEPIESRRLSLL
jgi:hypothetical protein